MRIIIGIAQLLAGFLNLYLAYLVWRKDPGKKANLYLALTALFSSEFVLSFGISFITLDPFWTKATWWGFLILPSVVIFLLYFSSASAKTIKITHAILWPSAIFFCCLAYTPLIIREVISIYPNKVAVGPWEPLARFYFALYSPVLYYLLIKQYLVSQGTKRLQIKYFLLGITIYSIVALVFSMIMPILGRQEFLPFTPLFSLLWIRLTIYAIIKHHLMDIRLAITKVTIFFVVYALTLGLPFWLFYATQNAYLSLAFAMILAFAGPIVHRMLQGKAEAVLLAKQKQYQRFLSQAARGMAREHNLEHLLNLIVHVVKHGVQPQFVGVFLFNEERKRYELRAVRGGSDYKSQITDYRLGNDDPLVELLRQNKKPLGHEEINDHKADIGNYKFNFPAHLIVPAFSDSRLLGFLVLGEKDDHTVYTEDDMNIFSILAQQAAMAIDNCLYMEAAKRNQQQLFEAEKLASVGGMAAGMSHQFKNRLNSFAQIGGGVASVSDFIKKEVPDLISSKPEFKENIEYLDECAKDIGNEVKRCNALVQGVIGYARERSSSQIAEFSFKEVVDSSIYLVKIKHQCIDRELPFTFLTEIEAEDKISTIKGHLNEILFNLLDNAYESIEEKVKYRLYEEQRAAYKPQVKVSLAKKGDIAMITVSDNGTGIKDEDKQKIFAPFFTTKASVVSGMGLGMYIIRRMVVEQMGGKIRFESTYLNGVTFFIELPSEKSDGQKSADKNV